MPSQLVCRPHQALPVAVLTVTGVLDQITGHALGSAVNRSLCSQPEALLIDASAMEVADAAGLDVLRSTVARTAEWPGVPVVLCGVALPGSAGLTVVDSRGEALERAATEPPRRIRARLRPVPDACRQVRQLVGQACNTWQRTELAAGNAALVASELVANVVRHAHTTMIVTMGARAGRLSLSVRDGSRTLPRPARRDRTEPGGRGLHLVRELSDSWGVQQILDGKVVWTRLAG